MNAKNYKKAIALIIAVTFISIFFCSLSAQAGPYGYKGNDVIQASNVGEKDRPDKKTFTTTTTTQIDPYTTEVKTDYYTIRKGETILLKTETLTTITFGGHDFRVTSSVTEYEYDKRNNLIRAETLTTSVDLDGSTSESTYTETYDYDKSGNLLSVHGTGTESSVDGISGITTSGTIDKTFIVKDGQALLTSSVTTGTISEADGTYLGRYSNTTTINQADYVKLDGSWVPTEQTSNSFEQYESAPGAADGNMTDMTRTTTYTRNSTGVITDISQTATGHRVVVNGDDLGGDGLAKGVYALTNYQATFALDFTGEWYLASEAYDWSLQ